MEHFLYIIYSPSKNTYYVGETHNLEERLQKHKTHSYDGSFTKMADDWKVALNYPCNSKEDAVYLERSIKRMKSKKFIIKIIADQSILLDILRRR